MTILPKAKKSHLKGDHGQKSLIKKKEERVERVERPAPPNQDETLNSDDEYGPGFKDDELEVAFVETMKKNRGFNVKVVKGDGACMFRAVADQIYGDEEMHYDVRRLCMDYIASNRDHFSQFITEDFTEYLARKRNVDVHGNHVELQAISEIFLRPIEIYEYHTEPINTFHPISREANTGQENPPIRLSYHGSVHYNSVVDPFAPTIGVGLGLPGYVPGQADRNLMKEATLASERQHIEEAMLKDKMKMTDWERTEQELERQIANESYMEFLRQAELQAGQRRAKSHHSSNQLDRHDGHGGRNGRHKPNHHHCDHPRLAGFPKFGMLGAKRGASSPNLPSTSRANDRENSPQAKIHRNEASASMPNIDATFGLSLSGPCSALMKPSTSTVSLKTLLSPNQPSTSSSSPQLKAGTSKDAAQTPTQPLGLYEELLASTAVYGEWHETDDTALLAEVIALSSQEYVDSLKKSPRSS